MTQLMFTHCMPASYTFMTSDCSSVTVTVGSNVVLKNKVLSYHTSSIPDKLVHIKRWRSIRRLLTLLPTFIRPLQVSWLKCVVEARSEKTSSLNSIVAILKRTERTITHSSRYPHTLSRISGGRTSSGISSLKSAADLRNRLTAVSRRVHPCGCSPPGSVICLIARGARSVSQDICKKERVNWSDNPPPTTEYRLLVHAATILHLDTCSYKSQSTI